MSGQDRIRLVKVMSGRVGSSEKKPGKVLLDKVGYLQKERLTSQFRVQYVDMKALCKPFIVEM